MLFSLEATVQGLSLCQSSELHWTCADTLEETRASDTSEEKTCHKSWGSKSLAQTLY